MTRTDEDSRHDEAGGQAEIVWLETHVAQAKYYCVDDDDFTAALMRLFEIPMTRENYLNIDNMGVTPTAVDPEVEAEMPEQFRRQDIPQQ